MKKIIALMALISLAFVGVYAQDAAENASPKVVVPMLIGEKFLQEEQAKPAPVARTDEDGMEGDSIYVMLVGFKDCNFCRNAENALIKPLFKQYTKQKYVKVVKVDKDEDAQKTKEASHQIVKMFQVEKFPTILVVHDKKVQWRYVGFDVLKVKQIKAAITAKIQEIVAAMKANYGTKRS